MIRVHFGCCGKPNAWNRRTAETINLIALKVYVFSQHMNMRIVQKVSLSSRDYRETHTMAMRQDRKLSLSLSLWKLTRNRPTNYIHILKPWPDARFRRTTPEYTGRIVSIKLWSISWHFGTHYSRKGPTKRLHLANRRSPRPPGSRPPQSAIKRYKKTRSQPTSRPFINNFPYLKRNKPRFAWSFVLESAWIRLN